MSTSTLIPQTGRKSLKARLAYIVIYGLLILGGITMVVPFVTMVSSSLRSKVDTLTREVPPRYFYDMHWLKLKYIEQESNYQPDILKLICHKNISDFTKVPTDGAANKAEQEDYYNFLNSLPPTFTILTCRGSLHPGECGTHPAVVDYRNEMLKQYKTLAEIEKMHGVQLPDRDSLAPPFEKWYERTYLPDYDLRLKDSLNFKLSQPKERRLAVMAEGIWNRSLRAKYVADVATANKELGTNYSDIESANIPLRRPKGPQALIDAWDSCVRLDMPIWFVRADESARPAWTEFLQKRYKDGIKGYNAMHPEAKFTRFEDIPLPVKDELGEGKSLIMASATSGEWADFLTNAPTDSLYLDTPEQRFREMLKAKYQTIDKLNTLYGTNYKDWGNVVPRLLNIKLAESEQNAGALRWEFAIRNYRTVASYLLLHGRAFLNTTIYILLALLFTLTINPITAYALSRFKLSSTNKILLFLLATMAFPAEIAMIPNFLILKELHLLNTFFALVLPGMASGFNIFLLKGMFDGLPQDLYEAAMLDGAGEGTIFWKVTMPLVKPFLAYLALMTFVGCYAAFMFAMLLCPDPKMWTIMVFLQQMHWASEPIKFAAYVLASIPTLIVYVTCQHTIMKGIVLPTEK